MESDKKEVISIPSGNYVLVNQERASEAADAMGYAKLLNLPPLDQISFPDFFRLYKNSNRMSADDFTIKGIVSRKMINDIEIRGIVPPPEKLELIAQLIGGEFEKFLKTRNYFEDSP